MVYDYEWYMHHGGKRPESAQIVVKLIADLLKPESVVDIGCGLGAWLAEFQRHGVKRVLGVDGDYVDTEWLQIPGENFHPHDLNTPLQIDNKFDLAISLEVAEHLKESTGPLIVKLLTGLAPIVIFSAAIPYQFGTAHINEKWPSYWVSLFREQGYVPIDYVRRQVWNNPDVSYYYKQNMLLYVKEDILDTNAELKALYQTNSDSMIDVVHPIVLEQVHVRRALIILRQAINNAVKKRLKSRN